MTLPEILALEPAQVRVMVAEKCGWTILPESEWLHKGDPRKRHVTGKHPDLYGGYPTEIPQLTLDAIAQAVAGLTDEEHGRYREILWKIVMQETPARNNESASAFLDRVNRAYIDASALQRARAFLASKSE